MYNSTSWKTKIAFRKRLYTQPNRIEIREESKSGGPFRYGNTRFSERDFRFSESGVIPKITYLFENRNPRSGNVAIQSPKARPNSFLTNGEAIDSLTLRGSSARRTRTRAAAKRSRAARAPRQRRPPHSYRREAGYSVCVYVRVRGWAQPAARTGSSPEPSPLRVKKQGAVQGVSADGGGGTRILNGVRA